MSTPSNSGASMLVVAMIAAHFAKNAYAQIRAE